MIYHDLDFEQYKKINALNSSQLKDFINSPLYCQYMREHPRESSPSFKHGTMVHKWVLEHSDFQNEYAVCTEEEFEILKKFKEKPNLSNTVAVEKQRRGTKAWKELESAHPNKELMFQEDYDKALKAMEIHNAIDGRETLSLEEFNNLKSLELRIEGSNELTVKFEHLGVKCKARFDSIIDNSIVDLKTTTGPYRFEHEFNKYKYWIQVGFYTIAYRHAYKRDPGEFIFVAVPNKMPYNDVAKYPIDVEYRKWAVDRVEEMILAWKECNEKKLWPKVKGHIIYKPSWLI
jgi:hypothetical protein